MPVTMDALKAGVFLMHGDMQGAHWCAKQTTIFCISRVFRALFIQAGQQAVPYVVCPLDTHRAPRVRVEGGRKTWAFTNLLLLVINTHRHFQGFITAFTF